MQLTILGGGGFRTPLVYRAVAQGAAQVQIDKVVLYDVSLPRLHRIAAVIEHLVPGPVRPELILSTELTDAVTGADFVFCAIRVGGAAGRVVDERVALDLGLLGQETIGPGGLAYALRSVPEAVRIASVVAERAPGAWLINFTNPAGIVTEAMNRVLPGRVFGICDTPIGLVRRCATALGVAEADLDYDYLGLNHLGWLRALRVDGVDRLPELLADDVRLDQIEEARLMGFDWIRAQGALPNEYLYYYWFTEQAVANITRAGVTRGEFLTEQQGRFYAASDRPAEAWRSVLAEREATYMAESRDEDRRPEDAAGGGYQQVALELMAALATGRPARMILDVANGSLVPQLPADATIEVACRVDGDGVHPLPVAPPTLEHLGLMIRLKAAERLALEAALTGDRALAWRAFAEHPLVNSPELGRRLLAGYLAGHPELAERFG